VSRRATRLGAVAVALAVAAACGGGNGDADGHAHDHGHDGHDHTHGPAARPADRTVAVQGKAVRFDPETITAKVGETVAVVFTAVDAEHDFRIDELAVHAHAKKGASATTTVKVDRPTTYRYYCSVSGHLQAGMKGQLVVTG
jgi:plastocyanin